MYERNEDNENADESEDYVNDKYEEQNDIVVKISEANITEENFSNSDECKWNTEIEELWEWDCQGILQFLILN